MELNWQTTKIEMIKIARSATYMGLVEAKVFTEQFIESTAAIGEVTTTELNNFIRSAKDVGFGLANEEMKIEGDKIVWISREVVFSMSGVVRTRQSE